MGKLFAWLFAAGKLGKLFVSGGSMIISMFVYSLTFGWRYAVGFVLLIFFHEMGHYRITAIISPKVWLLGVPLLLALFFYNPSPMLILIAIFAVPQLKAALQGDAGASGLPQGYYDVDINVRVNYGVLYLGLAGFLALMSYGLHNMLIPH